VSVIWKGSSTTSILEVMYVGYALLNCLHVNLLFIVSAMYNILLLFRCATYLILKILS